ncbi:MAG: hypothetical protein K9J12_10905 [Melioribacteraceae bacterium]|nr:hypothetical protein [Melioribacteraceae bacterium]MCF8264301.1 hypothetical protein [Melioribacteraceae bacterium]MCF8432277.1 hypothetical protein [Melioribacteraceae bacterium]
MNYWKGEYPGELSPRDKQILFELLPEQKPGYKNYRDQIEGKFVIGKGRFDDGNFVLGPKSSVVDLSIPSSSVFAIGNLLVNKIETYVVIHELDEDQIEFQISFSDKVEVEDCEILKDWSLSDWRPTHFGFKNDERVLKVADEFTLSISKKFKRIWVYSNQTEVNTIIPLTNFFNELMRVKRIREPETALRPNMFFDTLEKYSDNDYRIALLSYDKYLRRFGLQKENIILDAKPQKKKIFHFFKRS